MLANSKWDFPLYSPELVVINLLQNNSWLVNMPHNGEFKKIFGTIAPTDVYIIRSYQQFVSQIRKHYPNANIICMLGNMDITKEGSKWIEYIKQAVPRLNDEKIFMHFVSFKETRGHPSVIEQEDLANSLIQFIDNNIEW